MIGAFLNAFGILLGALFGLARREPLTVQTQRYFKSALGAFTAFCGLQLIWFNVGGSAFIVLKQFFIMFAAVMLGSLLGKLLGLQKLSNHFGRHTAKLLANAETGTGKAGNGFLAATILFCAAPLGIVGAVTDGLSGYYFPLAIKAVMDGLALTSFVKMFRWPVALAAIPVFLFLNGLTVAAHVWWAPHLTSPALIPSVNATAGMLICSMTLVIMEVRKVELANYLPALGLAPLLTHYLF